MSEQKEQSADEIRELIKRFMGSLTIADHLGDAWDDAFKLCELAGLNVPDYGDHGEPIAEWAGRTIWDTPLGAD